MPCRKRQTFFYTFNGEKLRKRVEDNGTLTKTDYCGPFVYETASGVRSLKYLITPYGRAVKNGSSWIYEYNLTDHLGNVRVVIRKGANNLAEVVQERHYYPFGMEMSELSYNFGSTVPNKYLYNGKELENDYGIYLYDYGWRFYDPQLVRFTTKDRFAEKYYYLTPYQYAGNNPISNIDFKGDSIIKVTINDKSGYIKGESALYIDHTIFDDTKAILEYAATNEVPIHLNSSFRTNKKQGGLTSANSTTPAAKSKSTHNAGLALDFNLYKNDKTSDGVDAGNSTVTKDHKFIKEVKSKNWRWGGDFTDPDKIHMDKRGTNSNFESIRDANQTQMDGYNKVNVDESLIKRTETISINKKDEKAY